MRRILVHSAAAAAMTIAAVLPAASQSQSQIRSSLEGYIRLALSADNCGFEMDADAATSLGDLIDDAIVDLDLPATGYDSIMLEIARDMANTGWSTLCRADGTWARQYRERLDAIVQP